MYYIYILRCHDDSLYTGITTDVKRRIYEHVNKTKAGAQYTKTRDVIKIEALWTCENRSLASKLEYKIKKYTKDEKEKLIVSPNDFEDYEKIEDLKAYDYLFKESV